MANVGDKFHANEKVPVSGIYMVTHDPEHADPHPVTCVYGESFPTCLICGRVGFELRRDAPYVMTSEHFNTGFVTGRRRYEVRHLYASRQQ